MVVGRGTPGTLAGRLDARGTSTPRPLLVVSHHPRAPAHRLPTGLGDSAAVVGAALVAKASGRGLRRIAADLQRPVSTVNRWLRSARGEHVTWLRGRGVHHAHTLDPNVLTGLVPQAGPLGDAMQALAAAVVAYRRRFEPPVEAWALIVMFVNGRLLTPAPAD
jgi:hypothetical protein